MQIATAEHIARMEAKLDAIAARLVWIDARLEIGTVNRGDIAAAFGISIPQTSNDLKAFQTDHPDCIEYDHRAKTYKRPRRSKPAFPQQLRLQSLYITHAVGTYRASKENQS